MNSTETRAYFKRCVELFNENPFNGINELENLIQEDQQEENIIEFLHNNNLDKQAIGDFLASDHGDKYIKAFYEYVNLEEIEFLDAIRIFCSLLILPGEAQKIDKIISVFSEYYINSAGKPAEKFNSVNAFKNLLFSSIMVNTQLHSPNITSSLEQFCVNCMGLNDNQDFEADFLANLYRSLKENPLSVKKSKFGSSKKTGYLFKQETVGWSEFYFMLTTNNDLYYFNNASDEFRDLPIGFFKLSNVSIDTSTNGENFIFTITGNENKIEGGKYLNNQLNEELFSSLVLATPESKVLDDWCDAILGNYKTLSTAKITKSAKK